MLFHYLAKVLSETTYTQLEEPLGFYIKEQISKIFSSNMGLPSPAKIHFVLNDQIISDLNIILEHLSPEQCPMIYESIQNSLN